jgi:hypothetical protein
MAHSWRTFKKTPATLANNSGTKPAATVANIHAQKKARITPLAFLLLRARAYCSAWLCFEKQ